MLTNLALTVHCVFPCLRNILRSLQNSAVDTDNYFSKGILILCLTGLFSFILYDRSVLALVLLLLINVTTTCHATKFISHDAHFRCN